MTDSTALPHISVAPMMDWTTRHCRYFHRLISPHTVLYTEMVTTGALIHGDSERFLRFHTAESPVVLQLGGSDPKDLALCAKMGAEMGYAGINLNCGCPSDRVQKGRIGACLMTDPDFVAECMESMIEAVDIPVSVKCRIGIDEQDSYEFLDEFVSKVSERGCRNFVIHARKAWLSGLSPKQNREVPELNYGRVAKIKQNYKNLEIILNGGIRSVEAAKEQLTHVDGVMIGREAYQNPYLLAEIEREIFGNDAVLSRHEVAEAMIAYAREQIQEFGVPVKSITRHIIGLFHEQSGARKWRQTLSTLPHEEGANEDVISKALEAV